MSNLAPGNTVTQDPDDVLDWDMDWTPFLAGANGDGLGTIAVSEWAVSGPDEALVIENDAILEGALVTRIFVSGGTPGKKYTLTNHITTNESPAREKDESFKIKIKQQ